MAIVRVREDIAAVVYDVTIGQHVALAPGQQYDDSDPIVKQFGWAFQSDAKANPKPRARSVEQATAAPGELR